MPNPLSWTNLPHQSPDIALVVCDMDGTLLDAAGRVPDGFAEMLAVMERRDIRFVPASGRQYATLTRMFPPERVGGYVAENGALVAVGGEVVQTTTVPAGTVAGLVPTLREMASERDLGLVLCGAEGAYIERDDSAFLAEVDKYYARRTVVADVLQAAQQDRVIKLAIFDFAGVDDLSEPITARAGADVQVVVSGANWMDVMDRHVDKGAGVRVLQEALGIGPERTVVFGDYLNDLEMMGAAQWSFAMANAHPDVAAAARFIAPTNSEHGVLRVLERLLAAPAEAQRPRLSNRGNSSAPPSSP